MADNYLENKMEEHRQRVVATARRRLTPSGQKPGFAAFHIGELVIYVKGFDDSVEVAAGVVRAFRNAGCRVAFSAADINGARILAQSCGARHYPLKTDTDTQVIADFGAVDFTVEVTPDRLSLKGGKTIGISRATDCRTEDFAAKAGGLCLYLVLPQSQALISGTVIITPDGLVLK